MLKRWLVALALTTVVALGLPASAAFANANPQDHCNYSVCIGAWSVGGSGPDIIAAEVETIHQTPVPLHTVFYLNYGSSPANAKARIPYSYCISNDPHMYGCIFSINKTLNVGWVLCGQIVHYVGYPCITIGR